MIEACLHSRARCGKREKFGRSDFLYFAVAGHAHGGRRGGLQQQRDLSEHFTFSDLGDVHLPAPILLLHHGMPARKKDPLPGVERK